MSNPRTRVGSGASVAMVLASSLLAVACGGGGGSTPAPAPGIVPVPDPITGLVGKCSSLSGGAPGYEVGYCNTIFSSGTVAEAVFQNRSVTGAETPNTNQYLLNLPTEWGGSIALVANTANVTQFPSAIGSITGGFALDKILPDPATDATSIVDFGTQLGTPRLGTFGLWGRSKLANELFFGAFAGPKPGNAATPASVLGGPASSATMNGAAVTWHLRSASTVVPAGVNPRQGLSATAQMTVNLTPTGGTISGNFSNFFVRVNGVTPTSVALAPVVFTGTLSNATGLFSGTITGGGTGIVKGVILGGAAEQAVGQFAGVAADGRLITGAFGVAR
jgi:hypothetical protein